MEVMKRSNKEGKKGRKRDGREGFAEAQRWREDAE